MLDRCRDGHLTDAVTLVKRTRIGEHVVEGAAYIRQYLLHRACVQVSDLIENTVSRPGIVNECDGERVAALCGVRIEVRIRGSVHFH